MEGKGAEKKEVMSEDKNDGGQPTATRNGQSKPTTGGDRATRGGKRGSGLSEIRFAILLMVPAMTLFTLIILYPLVNSLYTGLLDKSLLSQESEFIGLRNVWEFVSSGQFLQILKNTLIFTVGATLLPFVIGFALALILNTGIRGQGFLRSAFILPWLLPGVVVAFVWLWMFNANFGVLNGALRILGVIDSNVQWLSSGTLAMAAIIIAKAWQTFPWMMIMLLASLQTVPRELLDAAAVDGAGPIQRFRNVTVPHLRGLIFIVLLLEVIWNFQHFEIIYVMTGGGPVNATSTFAVELYETAFQNYNLGQAGAIGIVWMALLSVLVFVYIRYGGEEESA